MIVVKDNYLFRECSGDQYVGQFTCVLNQMEQIFEVSPYYFDYSEYYDLGKTRMKNVDSWVCVC